MTAGAADGSQRAYVQITRDWRLRPAPRFNSLFADCRWARMVVNAEDHVRKIFLTPVAMNAEEAQRQPDVLPVLCDGDRVCFDLGHLKQRMVNRTLFHPGRRYQAAADEGVLVLKAVPADY